MTSMSDQAKQNALHAARALEQRGQMESAIRAYESADAFDDAARLLMGLRRFKDAGQLLVDSLNVAPRDVGTLDAVGKNRALRAAICFSRGDELNVAVELLVALGERSRAADLLAKAGDQVGAARVLQGKAHNEEKKSVVSFEAAQVLEAQQKWALAFEAYLQLARPADAARMALRLARPAQAAALFADAGLAYESAGAWHQAGDRAKALEQLQRVPRDSAPYRQAAVIAIRLATELNVLDFGLEHFLTRFLSQRPSAEQELEALYLVGTLYERNNFIENAKDAFRKVLSVQASYRDAAERLARLDRETAGSAMVFEQILKEDAAFHGVSRGGPMSLPDLPELPSLPTLGVTSTPRPTPPVAPRTPRPAMPVASGAPPSRPTEPAAQWAKPEAPTMKSQLQAPRLEPGEVLADRYRIEQKIGQGGMAAVFRVHDLELGEDVALKMFTQLVDDAQMVARFKQELTLSRKLNHPNIVRLYDIGTLSGYKYITMELLTGCDLAHKLKAPLQVKTALEYLVQLCAALQSAHDLGVVHRDIKPANVFITSNEAVKLMDFGIAKGTATQGLTVAGMIAGTPEYMSPEQITGFDTVTASADLYAVGVMMYEMLAGAVPFKHAEVMPLLMMHVREAPPSLRSRNPAVSPELERITLKLLEKKPDDRFASCRELADALRAVVV